MNDLAWLIVAGVVCAWAVLRVMGSERERRVRELHYRLASATPEAEAHAPKGARAGGTQASKAARAGETPAPQGPVRSKLPR